MLILQSFAVNVILLLSDQALKLLLKWGQKMLQEKQCEKRVFQLYLVSTGIIKDIEEAIELAE